MKDIFNSYHKQKALSHLGILAISGVLAVSINMFILGGPSGDALKASIVEIQNDTQSEDIVISQQNKTVAIRNNQQMDNVEELSASFAFDSELLKLGDTMSPLPGVNISKIETTPGFINFIMTFDNPINISENSELMNIGFTKNEEKTIHFNPVNINFTDTQENNYSLSASSLIF